MKTPQFITCDCKMVAVSCSTGPDEADANVQTSPLNSYTMASLFMSADDLWC